MGFPDAVRTKVLVRCARICCLCFKQCGTKMEVHHIKQKAHGGDDTESNALPVCFDCHAEVGGYNADHPKGTKYKPVELVSRRDSLYQLVESGALTVQMLVKQLTRDSVQGNATEVADAINALPTQVAPTEEAVDLLQRLRDPSKSLDALGRKLSILNDNDAAWVIDSLVKESKGSVQAIAVLAKLTNDLPIDQQRVVVERTLRNVVLKGEVEQKASVLMEFDSNLLNLPDDSVKLAFFEDIFGIIERNQFAEVNLIVPALVYASEAVPHALWKSYVWLLICQAASSSFKGAPAANSALLKLNDDIAKAWLMTLDVNELSELGFGRWNHASRLSLKHRELITDQQRDVIDDLATLSWRKFCDKHNID